MATRHKRALSQAGPTHIKDLTPDPANRRAHNPRNIGMLTDALQKVGASRSIVIDEDGVILAGNGVVEAASEAGLTKLQVVEADGETIIAVRRRGLSSEQKRALAIYDNRVAELATWNTEQIASDVAAGLEMGAYWSDEELALLLSLRVGGTSGLTSPDAVPDIRPTDIQVGDLFELGRHRLVCGDSTKAADIERLLRGTIPPLMVTDPPYGVSYDPSWRSNNTKKLGKVTNDDRADWTEVWRLFPGSVAYVWHGGMHTDVVKASLEMAQFEMRAQIIWAKDRLVLSRGDYHWQHEPCWYAVRSGRPGARTPDRSQVTLWKIPTPKLSDPPNPDISTVWEIESREDGGHGHGTQKPVECMARPMRNHKALAVFEPFSGSGTTIIAAETLGRQCFACEIEPAYVQVAIDRWEAFTGLTATKVGEAVRA